MKTLPTIRYTWREGKRQPVDAQIVGKEIEAVEREHGWCSPAELVERARPTHSPIHPLFEWDDDKAAGAYRRSQATRIIQQIDVVLVGESTSQQPGFVRVFQANPEETVEDESQYVSIGTLQQDEGKRAHAARLLWRTLKPRIEKSAWLPEFQPLRDAIPEVERLIAEIDREQEEALAAD